MFAVAFGRRLVPPRGVAVGRALARLVCVLLPSCPSLVSSAPPCGVIVLLAVGVPSRCASSSLRRFAFSSSPHGAGRAFASLSVLVLGRALRRALLSSGLAVLCLVVGFLCLPAAVFVLLFAGPVSVSVAWLFWFWCPRSGLSFSLLPACLFGFLSLSRLWKKDKRGRRTNTHQVEGGFRLSPQHGGFAFPRRRVAVFVLFVLSSVAFSCSVSWSMPALSACVFPRCAFSLMPRVKKGRRADDRAGGPQVCFRSCCSSPGVSVVP